MKKIVFLMPLLLLSLTFLSQEGPPAEKDPRDVARYWFARSLISWAEGDYKAARRYLTTAMSGEVYLEDIPEYWYFMAKLDLEEGNVEKAHDELDKVSLFVYKPEVAFLIEFIDSVLKGMQKRIKVLDVRKVTTYSGVMGSIEYFYSPVAVDAMGNTLLILDGANDRLVKIEDAYMNIMNLGKMGITKCRDMMVDHMTGWIYISTGEGKIYRVRGEKSEEFAKGFIYPKFVGVDRIGNVYILDVGRARIVKYDFKGEYRWDYTFRRGFSFIPSASLLKDRIYFLDLRNRKVGILKVGEGIQPESVPFPENSNIVRLSVGVSGILFGIDDEGNTVYWSGNRWVKIHLGKADGLRVLSTFIFLWSMDSNEVAVGEIHLNEPTLLVNINAISVKPGIKVKVIYRITDRFGNLMPFSPRFTEIKDSGGRVGFDVELVFLKPQIHRFKNAEEFKSNFVLFNRVNPDVVILEETNSSLELKCLFPLLLKNIVLYTTASDELSRYIAWSSGGSHIQPDELPIVMEYLKEASYPVWKAGYEIPPPLTPGIKMVTVSLNFGGFEYTDTVYYLKEMFESERESTATQQQGQ
ncbi:MAG: hypothetical protein J7L52_04570 [Thermotogae bacterium]|nr:hypothetical protein [Thermotogota bacterium]